METDWRQKAECLDADPEVFFPEAGSNGLAAKRICARCEVKQECLDYAMVNRIDDGVWGGTAAVERERMRGVVRERDAA